MSNKGTNITVDDRIFGRLHYHKKYLNNNFPGDKFICLEPFSYTEVRLGGDVNICCTQWNPAVIGNVLTTDFSQIWNGEKAQIIRNTILDGSYSYCNGSTCPKMLTWHLDNDLISKTEISVKRAIDLVTSTPPKVHFVIDRSCNLTCPSCRATKLTQLDDAAKQQALTVFRRTTRPMFATAHLENKTLSFDGSGEIFSSEVYRELFETEEIFTQTYRWPNLRFELTTNGTMMTEKIQKKYFNLFDHTAKLEVSIDAGNKASYNITRVGGHWDLLWENMQYFHDNTLMNSKIKRWWKWNIIVQRDNFESIPDLLEIANKFHKLPTIHFSNLLNWGTWQDSEYLARAVHLPDHPLHQRYMEILNLPIVQNYRFKHGGSTSL